LLSYLVVLTSCVSTTKLIKERSTLSDNISLLNGIYENIAIDASDDPKSEHSLYVLLFKNFHQSNPYYNKDQDYEGKIRINVISDEKIRVDYIVNDNVIKSKIFKGELNDNFFVVKRKWRLFGIPILLGVYDESKIAIGLENDNYLLIRKGFYNIGGLVGFMANSNEDYIGVVFKLAE